jgi:multiple sugar transport system permease protein/raffinose/stachyose/melibiose transport system permease protein
MKKDKIEAILLKVFLYLGGLIMLLPFLWLMLSTFKNGTEITAVPTTFFPRRWTIENYIDILKNFNIGRYFLNSVFLSTIKTFIALYTSLLCGYVLAKFAFRGKKFVFGIILFTMMVPYLIMVIPLYQMINKVGLIDSYLALILPSLYSSFGIFMMKQYMMEGVPNDLIDAARIDGVSEFRIFHSIAIPLSTNMISALAIFLFLWNWEDFLWPYLVLTTKDKMPLAVALNMFSGQNTVNYGGLFAATAVTILPILVTYLFFQNKFVEGISMSGIK